MKLINIFGEEGSLICLNCSIECRCCTILEPPELTSYDKLSISSAAPELGDSFFEDHPDPRAGSLKKMVPRNNNSCRFFADRRCRFKEHRPILCKLFPLDICTVKGEYVWIFYYDFCPLAQIEEAHLSSAMRQAEEKLLPLVHQDELTAYAKHLVHNFSLFRKGEYKILQHIELFRTPTHGL